MGPSGGTKRLRDYKPEEINLQELQELQKLQNHTDRRKMKVVIDVLSVMNRYVIGSFNTGKYVVDKEEHKIMEIYYLLIIAIRLLSFGLLPIFVFEGRSPEQKKNTIEKRCQAKNIAEDKLEQLEQLNDSEQLEKCDNGNFKTHGSIMADANFIKYLKRSYRPNITNVQRAKLLLGYMGLPVIEAPGEADSQCAVIAAIHTDVLGVITDDFDALMFMSPNILRMDSLGSNILYKYSLQNTIENLQNKMNKIIANSTNKKLKQTYSDGQITLTYDNFREICCLMGTDYCPGLKLKSFKGEEHFNRLLEVYAINDMSLEKVLHSMHHLDVSYVKSMLDSLETYKNAEVLDPNGLKDEISMGQPNIDIVKNICAEFLHEREVRNICNLLTKFYCQHYQSDQIGQNNQNNQNTQNNQNNQNSQYNQRYLDSGYGSLSNKAWPDPMYFMPITITV